MFGLKAAGKCVDSKIVRDIRYRGISTFELFSTPVFTSRLYPTPPPSSSPPHLPSQHAHIHRTPYARRGFSSAIRFEMPVTRQQDTTDLASRTKMKQHAPGATPVARSHRSDATDCTTHWEDEEHLEQNKKDFLEFRAQHDKSSSPGSASGGSDSGDHGEVPGGMKRGRGANQAGKPGKKAKSDSNDDGDAARVPKGDKTRVPAVGQSVHWVAGGGYEKGEVVEVLYEGKVVEGEKVEASREDPRLVLKTDSSGKVNVHKPEDVHFD